MLAVVDPVLFPDSEELAASYLRANLPDYGFDVDGDGRNRVRVGTLVPKPRPKQFVLVRRLGGPRLNLIADDATIGVECWSMTQTGAHDLAQICRALLYALRGTSIDGQAVYRMTEIAGVQSLPDPLSDEPRYVFTLSLALRGEALTAGS